MKILIVQKSQLRILWAALLAVFIKKIAAAAH